METVDRSRVPFRRLVLRAFSLKDTFMLVAKRRHKTPNRQGLVDMRQTPSLGGRPAFRRRRPPPTCRHKGQNVDTLHALIGADPGPALLPFGP